MRKVAYIIPGYTEYQHGKVYKKIAMLFKSAGIIPIPVWINWKGRKTMTDYINQFYERYNIENRKDDEVYLLGFSFGAFISFVSAVTLKPKTVILCSLSPYFSEDIKYLKKSWKMGKNKMSDFKNYKFSKLVKSFHSNVFILVGSKEGSIVLKRARTAHKTTKNSKLIIIDKAKHNIRQKEYFYAVKLVIESLA